MERDDVAFIKSDNYLAFSIGGRAPNRERPDSYLTDIVALQTTLEWQTIGNLIKSREGHVSIMVADDILSCGGQSRALVHKTCESFTISN